MTWRTSGPRVAIPSRIAARGGGLTTTVEPETPATPRDEPPSVALRASAEER